MNPSELKASYEQLRVESNKVLVGLDGPFELLIVALLTGGHVLLEGVPGTAKTLMAKTLAHMVQARFSRIQFTPDLMPSDILGTSVFDMGTSRFYLKKGPIFTQFLLADEINRAPAKTQSALLEAMEERQVNLDGDSSSSPPRTRSNTRAPIRSPRPSSTASCSKSWCLTLRWTWRSRSCADITSVLTLMTWLARVCRPSSPPRR